MKRILLIMLFLLLPLAYADTYPTTAGTEGRFNEFGIGIFDNNVADSLVGQVGISSRTGVPLVEDLDGDGINEIIIHSGTSISIFRNKTLDAVASISAGGAETWISNMVITNFDDDIYKELLFAREVDGNDFGGTIDDETLIYVYEYNGSVFKEEYRINHSTKTQHLGSSGEAFAGQFLIGCDGGTCLLVDNGNGRNNVQNSITGNTFNRSGFGFSNFTIRAGTVSTGQCFSMVAPHIEVRNINGDGDPDAEFIFTTGGDGQGGHLHIIDVSSSLVPSIVSSTAFGVTLHDPSAPASQSCRVEHSTLLAQTGYPYQGGLFTPPSLIETGTNTYDILIGMKPSASEFRILHHNSGGTFVQEFGDSTFNDAQGDIISNVVVGNFRVGNGDIVGDDQTQTPSDFCMLGYDFNDPVPSVEVLCGSTSPFDGVEHVIHVLNSTSATEINRTILTDKNRYPMVIYSGDHDQRTIRTTQPIGTLPTTGNVAEVVTPFGILALERTPTSISPTCNGLIPFTMAQCPLEIVYQNPTPAWSNLFSIDYEETDGLDDIIVTTETQIRYYDGIGSNLAPEIDLGTITTNPCLTENNPIQVNTSVFISFTVNDQSVPPLGLDQVNAKITLNKGSSEEIIRHGTQSNSGTEFSFGSIVLNLTGTYEFEIVANDTNGNTDTYSNFYTVVNEGGITFGDVVCEGVEDPEEEGVGLPAGTFDDIDPDGAFSSALTQLVNATGLGSSLFWVILMFITAGLIISGGTFASANPQTMLVGVGIAELFMLVVGTLIGALSAGVLIVLVVLMGIPLAFWVRNLVAGNSTQ